MATSRRCHENLPMQGGAKPSTGGERKSERLDPSSPFLLVLPCSQRGEQNPSWWLVRLMEVQREKYHILVLPINATVM